MKNIRDSIIENTNSKNIREVSEAFNIVLTEILKNQVQNYFIQNILEFDLTIEDFEKLEDLYLELQERSADSFEYSHYTSTLTDTLPLVWEELADQQDEFDENLLNYSRINYSINNSILEYVINQKLVTLETIKTATLETSPREQKM